MLVLLSDLAVLAFLIALGVLLEWAWHRLRQMRAERQSDHSLPG